MEKYRNVKDHAAFSVALVLRSSDVLACHVIMVRDFAVVRDGRVEWTGLSLVNAAYQCIFVIHLLLTRKRFQFTVLLEMLDYFAFPLNELVEKC